MTERDEALERAREYLDFIEVGKPGGMLHAKLTKSFQDYARAEVVRELRAAAELIDMDSPCAWLRARADEIEAGK